MPQSPRSLPTDITPSAFHREFENNYLKCHNHRRPCRRIYSRRHFTESSKIITWNATITDVYTDNYKSVGKLSAGQVYRQKYWRTARIPKDCALKCISNRVIVPTELPTDHQKNGGSLKILVRNSKFTDGFLTLHRRNKLK